MDYSKFTKSVKALHNYSKHISTETQAIEIVLAHTYCFALNKTIQTGMRPFVASPAITKVGDLYTPKDDTEHSMIWESLKELTKLYKESRPFEDVLTNVYGGYLGFKHGQHMTPPDLASALFYIMDSDNHIGKRLSENNTFSFHDPACGTGSLALAQLRGTLEKYGEEALERTDIFLCDIDKKMCLASTVALEMSSLQHGINYNQLTIYNQNSLLELKPENKFLEIIPNALKHKKVRKLYDYEKKEANQKFEEAA